MRIVGLSARAILLGLALGAIAVAATYVLSGGQATALDHVAAFTMVLAFGT